MALNVYDVLEARGYTAQVTHPEPVRALLAQPGVKFYVGFDPTADSLHLGHFIQIMVMAHLQRAGHIPIALMGGGTGMIGDPSGRSDMRQMLTPERIEHNVQAMAAQMSRLIDFSEGKGYLENNANWLLNQNYIEFLREIGPHFSVNRMLSAECYKQRLEVGLTFLEFNYMLLQAFDFYILNRKYGCQLELGGDDQWSNIIAGVELIRRKQSTEAYGLTFKLLTNYEGQKMGKTAKGALWLDPNKCPPFEFYQYLRNTADPDVIRYLKLLTFVPLEEIEAYAQLEGAAINEAKKRLAYEVTALIHGAAVAEQCAQQARELFEGQGRSDQMETLTLQAHQLGEPILEALVAAQFLPSKGEGRRLIQQGGLYLNDQPIEALDRTWQAADFAAGEAILRKGKKKYLRLILAEGQSA